MQLIPSKLFFEIFDVHFLSKGKTILIDSIMFAPGKIVHEFMKTTGIKILGGTNPGNFFQSIAVILVGKTQFFFSDMNDC